ncbi:hypothetical protein [Paenibacillus alvei]|nr:hypothetical protein [Paenibacillus alvei]EJW17244.1 hypothetical protein PAV_4c03470 [Paenibacillus alvei DSM 29]
MNSRALFAVCCNRGGSIGEWEIEGEYDRDHAGENGASADVAASE